MKRVKEAAALFVGIGLVVFIMSVTGMGCPIKAFTGVSCGGCGMTRALNAAVHLQFRQAFSYHPLFWVLPVGAVLFLAWESVPRKLQRVLLWGVLTAFVGVYLFRLLNPSDAVVTADIQSGWIARTFTKIF